MDLLGPHPDVESLVLHLQEQVDGPVDPTAEGELVVVQGGVADLDHLDLSFQLRVAATQLAQLGGVVAADTGPRAFSAAFFGHHASGATHSCSSSLRW